MMIERRTQRRHDDDDHERQHTCTPLSSALTAPHLPAPTTPASDLGSYYCPDRPSRKTSVSASVGQTGTIDNDTPPFRVGVAVPPGQWQWQWCRARPAKAAMVLKALS